MRLRTVADAAMRRSPAQLVSRRMAGRHLAVLAYHGVDRPEQFARQLDLLCRRARPVSLDAVLRAVTGNESLPERAVLVTFDDGHRSVLEQGLPLLRERQVPAVVFVLPGLLDSARPFWWHEVDELVRAGARGDVVDGTPAGTVSRLKLLPDDARRSAIDRMRRAPGTTRVRQPQLATEELSELRAGGVDVGNHTSTHPCLDRCSDEVVEAEIRQSHADLTTALGEPPRAFAYPNGNWDARAEKVLTSLGYRVAFLFDHRLTRLADSHPLRLSRLRVGSDTSLDRFATVLSGLHPAVHHARGGS